MIGKYNAAVVFLVEAVTKAAEVSINTDGSQKDSESIISPLTRSRMLTVPIAKDVSNAEYEHASFW